MSTQTPSPPAPATGTGTGTPSALADAAASVRGVIPYRLSVEQFMQMIQTGVFRDRDRVELIEGLLVKKMTKHNPHHYATLRLGMILRGFLPPGWLVFEEKSLRLDPNSRPEPALAVVRGPVERYRAEAPGLADLAFVVEVADASYRQDRNLKWRAYASAGVPVYWIVNLPGRAVEVQADPAGRGKAAGYRVCDVYDERAQVPVVIEGREVGRVAVGDLLPGT